jgi:hypothetical protein
MNSDHVRNLIAQQRAIESRKPPKLCGEPRLGDVVAFVISVVVLTYALIDGVIRLLP